MLKAFLKLNMNNILILLYKSLALVVLKLPQGVPSQLGQIYPGQTSYPASWKQQVYLLSTPKHLLANCYHSCEGPSHFCLALILSYETRLSLYTFVYPTALVCHGPLRVPPCFHAFRFRGPSQLGQIYARPISKKILQDSLFIYYTSSLV